MSIIFIDFEATSLGPDSRPIEFAACDEEGHFWAFFIKPEPTWTDWDAASQALHGITQAEIQRFGHSAKDASDRVFTILLEADYIYSDHPLHDEVWLAELLRVGGYAPRGFRLRDVSELYRTECEPVMKRDGEPGVFRILNEAQEAEERRVRTRHRAGPDARGLWWQWGKIRRLVELSGA